MPRTQRIDPDVKAIFRRAHDRAAAARIIDAFFMEVQKYIYGFAPAGQDPLKDYLFVEKDHSGNKITALRFKDGEVHWPIKIELDEDFIKITAPPEILEPFRHEDDFPDTPFNDDDYIPNVSYRSKSDDHHEIVECYKPGQKQPDSIQFVAPLQDFDEMLTVFFSHLMDQKEEALLTASYNHEHRYRSPFPKP